MDGPGYRTLAAAVGRVFPEAIVAPGLLVGGTDAKHYVPLSRAAYRFRPIRFTPDDVSRIHGANERIRIDDYARLVEFYAAVLGAQR
jgi:carboxypeptidase PM20D1